MKLRHSIVTLLAVLLLVSITTSCASNRNSQTGPSNEDIEDAGEILARPIFNKTVRRPLGRILISWQTVENASYYKVETSPDQSFDTISESWSTTGRTLEIPAEAGDVFWVRVQSVNSRTSSRWSRPLEVREADL